MKISVVIPMFNASKTILKCIHALAEQDVLPEEVIMVDNNSTDQSQVTVQEAMKQFPGLNIILCNEVKKGPSAARNKGAFLATGDIVAFTDSDCVPTPSWVCSIKQAFSKDDDLDGMGGVNVISFAPTTVMGKFLSAFWLASYHIPESLIQRKKDYFDQKVIISFNCAFRKAFFRKINGFDETFIAGEDVDITLRAVEAGGKIMAWHAPMAVYHLQDIPLRSLVKREFSYARGLVVNIDRHFRGQVFICLPRNYYHWRNNMGLTMVLMTNVLKVLFLIVALSVSAWISPTFLLVMFLSACLYYCFKIRKEVQKKGSTLTGKETITAFFIYAVRELSEYYGRLYWSCRYRVICM